MNSLTIGPQLHKTNTEFWEGALNNLPPLPSVDNVTIIYNYPTTDAFDTNCWEYFDRMLTSRDLFPALKSVLIESSTDSPESSHWYPMWQGIDNSLRTVRVKGLKLAISKSLVFERDHRTNPLTTRRLVAI